MLAWGLLVLATVMAVEVALRLPLSTTFTRLAKQGQKAAHILRSSRISDHWKEKVMLVYACSLFKSTMKLCGFLLTIGAVAALLMFAFDFFGVPIGTFIASSTGMLFSIVAATAYFTIRKFFA